MEDVANDKIANVRKNFMKWEDEKESLAPLTPEERDSIIEVASVTNLRPLPKCKIKKRNGGGPSAEVSLETKFKPGSSFIEKLTLVSEGKIESSQQFLNWYTTIEHGMEKEQDGPYHDYMNQLESHRKECHTLLEQLNQALENLQKLSDQYKEVSLKTGALHTDCEHLLAEQTRLSSSADNIERKLSFFTESNRIMQKLSSPAFQVTSDSFIPLLAKIDECLSFMTTNSSYLESYLYSARYRLCQNRALGMVKTYVTKSLEDATQNVLPKPGSEKPSTDNALVLFYGKFRTNAPRIKSLMSEIEDRIEVSPEYTNLLNDCHHCYFAQRKTLMEPCVSDAIAQLSVKYSRDYCSLVRSGCAFLVHVCEDEYNLFHQFFSLASPELDKFLHSLCSILYDVFRPFIIHIDHLETLSELCNILRRGMIEEHIQSNPVQLSSLTAVVMQLLEDCQERLVYRAHIYMQSDIANFSPSAGDLAYPAKLKMMESIAESLAEQQRKHHSRSDSISSMASIRSSASEEVASITSNFEERISRVGSSPADLHGMWYPTVRRTLMCLSKVYRCVDRSIFQGVSLEALAACMQSLAFAGASIRKNSSPLDALLFEIKHLLILREQLAPFQVEASLREMSLDWSKLKEAAVGLVNKRGRLFSLTSNNSLLEFIVEGTPQVTENILDSKRDVDNRLKKICEEFISTCTEMLVGLISSFLAKTQVILQMNREEDVKPISLKNQPFAHPEKVADVISSAQRNIRSHLPTIQQSLRLYLSNKDTEFILLKPVRGNVLGSFEKCRHVFLDNYEEDDRRIIACPSHEEVAALVAAILKS